MFKRVLWWVLCLSAALMWVALPISLQLVETYNARHLGMMLMLVAGGASIVFSASLMLALYQGWKSLQTDDDQDDTPFRQMRSSNIGPTQAVAYMFVPIFNVYWQFVAFAGWCKQARLRQADAGESFGVPPVGVAIAAIVCGWGAGILLMLLPPLGFALGMASTAAYLIVAQAMLTWKEASLPSAQVRGLAYFGIVDNAVDVRLVLGTIVTSAAVAMVMTTAYFYINPVVYDFLADMDRNLLQSLMRRGVVTAMTVPVIVALPAFAGWALDIRSPWMLIPFVLLASVLTSAFTEISLGLWDGGGLPNVDGLVSIASYWFVRAAAIAAVIGLLSVTRSAVVAMAAGVAVVNTVCSPLINGLSHLAYMLTTPDAYVSWSGALMPLSSQAHWAGLTAMQCTMVAFGVVVVHTAFRSPLVTPQE